MKEERDGLYYCPDCNKTYEYRNINSDDCPKCIIDEHKHRVEITHKQYINWVRKDNPILEIKKKEKNDNKS